MKFRTKTGEILPALSKVNSVVPSKSIIPILEYILFDLVGNTLTLRATDQDISQTVSLEVKGSEDGRIALPAKRLLDTVKQLPDTEIVFSIDTSAFKAKITTSSGEYNISGEDAKEFPPLLAMKEASHFELDGGILRRIINRTVFAASTDELRPAMMGVLFQSKDGELRAVSTDGHRLVRYSQKLTKTTALKRDVIVPAKALNALSRTLEPGQVTILVDATNIRFEHGTSVLVSRIIDETYPNYESVIPTENDKVMTIRRDNLISTIRRVALYASATTHQIKLSLRRNEVTVSAQDVEFGGEAKEKLECEYEADDLDIGFNAVYLLDILTHLESEQVVFKFSTPTRAGVVSPAGENAEDVLMLVMPVRLTA
jgi:DNA polymerase-3 subunit beta